MTTGMPAGARFGAYEILAPIGAGGMGEVYKARDTRLDRVIALKVLPEHWARDFAMKQRFEREARIIASLNHPNICVLHDIGQQDGRDFLVMEYLEGETLAARLDRGPIPWEEASKLALRIADALDKAHRRGVVHRDLKPSNIILTASGPKLLDFGLAKLNPAAASGQVLSSQAPTLTVMTTPGALIGTLQYMAPEQLEGTEAGPRTDIFAFGMVFHEMITGKKTFEGKSRVMLMAAIAAGAHAPLSKAQPAVPGALEHVIDVCLAKDPADRWQTARDVYAELEWAVESGSETGSGGAALARARRRRQMDWISQGSLAVAVLLVAAVALPAALYWRGPGAPEEFRFRVPISADSAPDTTSGNAGRGQAGSTFAISPDGRAMVYENRAVTADPFMLFIRPLDSVAPQRLPGTENAEQPFWSGDGRFIGFVVSGKMKKVEVTGGPPQDICGISGFSGAAWNRDGVIIIGSPTGLLRVSAEGGAPEPLTTLEPGEAGHLWPQFLPDGVHYLYTSWTEESSKRAVMVGKLGSKQKTRVAAVEANAAVAVTEPSRQGYLLFYRGSAVYAQPFDTKKLTVSGEPFRVADEVTASSARGNFAASPNGALVFFTGIANAGNAQSNASSDLSEWQLAWIDRAARVVGTPGPPGAYRGFDVSPDGARIAAHRHDAKGGDIVVIEPRGSVTTLTFDATHHNSSPIWSPKGDKIVYSALENGKWGLYQVLSNGSGTEEKLYESEAPKAPTSWSPDGKRIVFWVQDPKNSGDLWVLTLDGEKNTAAPLISTPFNETRGQISPDGKWIAYTSNRTGMNEVWVQPFPSGTGLWRISYHGGDWPRWNPHNPKELFYRAIAGTLDSPAQTGAWNPDLLFTVPVSSNGAEFIPSDPKPLLTTIAHNIPHTGGDYQFYAIGAKGDQILYGQFSPGSATTPAAGAVSPDPLRDFTVAMHWESGLKKE